MKPIDVVQKAIIRFRDDRVREKAARKDVRSRTALFLDQPTEKAVTHHSDTVSIGDQDRTVGESGLLEPRGSSHLSVPILGKPAAENRVG